MPLKDYLTEENDEFIADSRGQRFNFPCHTCLYRHYDRDMKPCNGCGYNLNKGEKND